MKRRLLLISNFFPPHVKGGAEIACAQFAGWLAAQGHEVAVLSLAPPDEEDSVTDTPEGYRVYRRRIPNVYHTYQHDKAPGWKKPIWHLLDHGNPATPVAVKGVIADFRPDLVNTHNLQGMGYNLWCVLGQAKLPVLVTLHDPALACLRSSMFKDGQSCATLCLPCRVSKRMKAGALAEVDRLSFVSPSRALLEVLRPHFPAHAREIAHIPYVLRHTARTTPPRESARAELLYVGQVSTHKGVEFLLACLAELAGEASFRITLLGRGPSLEALRERYARCEWVRFEGFVAPSQVGDYMSRADLLLIPSLWIENAPLVASEAIFLGLPLITSDRGGLPELVADGVTGRALPAGDAEAWKTALREVLRDPQLLARWREASVQRRGEFDADVLGARYLELIERTIAR